MPENGQFQLTLERVKDYEFNAKFDWEKVAPLLLDEPEPLGKRKGPNAARLLGAAVGNCLSASLLFCLQKAKMNVRGVQTDVTGTMVRNEKGRLRLGKLEVHIRVDIHNRQPQRVSRCIELFEDYCVVTASVRKGVEVTVLVSDTQGNRLFEREDG
ncbi:MAG: OsmC family protein [bacterium]